MEERVKKLHRCCFTGHRPERSERSEEEILPLLEKEISKAIEEGFNVFISGMSRGFDILAAEAVCRIRRSKDRVILVCAVPYKGFEKRWSFNWTQRYRNILDIADFVCYISLEYREDCFRKRNEWMVDHSSRVIAEFNGTSGGTKNTIGYARRKGIPIYII